MASPHSSFTDNPEKKCAVDFLSGCLLAHSRWVQTPTKVQCVAAQVLQDHSMSLQAHTLLVTCVKIRIMRSNEIYFFQFCGGLIL